MKLTTPAHELLKRAIFAEASAYKGPSEEDKEDAKQVLRDTTYFGQTYKLHPRVNLDDKFDDLPKPVKIPLDKVSIQHDYGRRPSKKRIDNPIITMQKPDGSHLVLDGQHRVLAKRERGDTHIQAHVVNFNWKKGSMSASGAHKYIAAPEDDD